MARESQVGRHVRRNIPGSYRRRVRGGTFRHMSGDLVRGTPLSYSEVRARLSSRAAFESHQEGTGKSPSYVLNVRPRYKGYEPFTLMGPDPAELLREALERLVPG